MKNPKVSVIVPVYNVEKYLEQCILSVLNQTLQNIELILVDDGSTDQSSIICDDWAKKDSRIRVIHKRNEGLGLTRNAGMLVAKGRYLTFLDSDDYVDKDTYLTVYNESEKSKLDICYFKHRRFKSTGEVIEVNKAKTIECFFGHEKIKQLLLEIVGPHPSNHSGIVREMSSCMALFKTETIRESSVKFVSERLVASEDLVFHLDLLPHVKNAEILPDVFYNYRITDGSISRTYNEAKKERLLLLLDVVKEKLSSHYEWNEFKGHYYSQILRVFKVILRYESIAQADIKTKNNRIKKICDNYRLEDIYADPLIRKYPLRDRFFLWCMRKRISIFFVFIYKI